MNKAREFDPATLTAEQFKTALISLGQRVTDQDRTMLRAHYHAPGHSLSARQMAEAAGFKNHAAANLRYGRFAGLLLDLLGRAPDSVNLFVLAEFEAPRPENNNEWLWVMRPQLAQALQELHWV